MMRLIKGLFIVLIVVLGITFSLLNAQHVVLDYYVGSANLPLSLLLAMVLCLGAALGFLSMIHIIMKLKRRNRKLNKHLKRIDKELSNLRTLPLQDNH